ncbi:MAG: BspA family leucine-rich repeat surface protein [Bacteroidales bacterium]
MKITKLILALLLLCVCVAKQAAWAQETPGKLPELEKTKTPEPDGKYVTNDVIRLESYYDEWLNGDAGRPSWVKVRLNTGDTIKLDFAVKTAEDLVLPFGERDSVNFDFGSSLPGTVLNRGVNRFFQLQHGKNKGKYLIAGAFKSYDGHPDADYMVIVNEDGVLEKTFELNHYVFWAVEDPNDGSIIAGGAFTDYGQTKFDEDSDDYKKREYYDYLVKFDSNFDLDERWMDNYISTGKLSRTVGAYANSSDVNYASGMCDNNIVMDDAGAIYVSGLFDEKSDMIHAGKIIPNYKGDYAKMEDGKYVARINYCKSNGLARFNADGKFDETFLPRQEHDKIVDGKNTAEIFATQREIGPLLIDGDYIWVAGAWYEYRVEPPRPQYYEYTHNYTFLFKLDRFTGSMVPDEDYKKHKLTQNGAMGGPLGLLKMPGKDKGGPGGILMVGRSGGRRPSRGGVESSHGVISDANKQIFTDGFGNTYNDRHIIPIQENGQLTSSEDFNIKDIFNVAFSVDAAVILKNKLWVTYRPYTWTEDGEKTRSHRSQAAAPGDSIVAEGCLVVFNLDGTLSDMNNTWGQYHNEHNGDLSKYTEDDRNGEHFDEYRGGFSGGKWDGMTLSTSTEGNLLLGGNFNTIALSQDEKKYQGVAVVSFQRCFSNYVPSSDDLTPYLEILEIVESDVTDMFGNKSSFTDLPAIADRFHNNHRLAINMAYTAPEDAFITEWQLDAGDEITIPTNPDLTYNYYVDWGDGPNSTVNITGPYNNTDKIATHKYADAGNYKVKIYCANDSNKDEFADGTGFPAPRFDGLDETLSAKLVAVDQWGAMKWESMELAFAGCPNLKINAADAPILSAAKSLESMFDGATSMNSNLSAWDVSTITNMKRMFAGATAFNNADQPLSWAGKTSKVTTMMSMFEAATAFNQSVAGWNVSALTDASMMFKNASLFNNGGAPLSWAGKTSKVTTMMSMFEAATAFNQSVAEWNVSALTDASSMFKNASLFNNGVAPGGDNKALAWTSTKATITTMAEMFSGASVFNQDVSSIKTDVLTSMSKTFKDAAAFNQDLSKWNTAKVSLMDSTFEGAVAFSQDLTKWKINSLTTAKGMFLNSGLTLEHYDALLISWWFQVNAGTASETAKTGVLLDASSKYCAGEVARKKLIDKGWTINDAGSGCEGFFITEWEVPTGGIIKIERKGNSGGPMDVLWGDGAVDYDVTGEPKHTYEAALVGTTVTIKMRGEVSMYWGYGTESIVDMTKVVKFGSVKWSSMENMFCNAKRMVFDENIDVPDLSGVTSMAYAFSGCKVFNSSLTTWDVSTVTNMEGIFLDALAFNSALDWRAKTASVENFNHAFRNASAFNQDISGWNVSSATKLNSMFESATSYNQPMSSWNTSAVAEMKKTFKNATSFNQDLSAWEIPKLTNAEFMFEGVTLSIDNYDALLISWNTQYTDGAANSNVKFHGGNSKFCKGAEARKNLIVKGWGDGYANASTIEYIDILDGGSAAPDISSLSVQPFATFQGMDGKIELRNTLTDVQYYVQKLDDAGQPDGLPISKFGASGAVLQFNMGALTKTTNFDVWAELTTGEVCQAHVANGGTTIEVYQQPDLNNCTVEVLTSDIVADGVAKHQIKVTVVDMLGQPISGASVKLAVTNKVTFSNDANGLTDTEGEIIFYATSTTAGIYSTKVSAYTYIDLDTEEAKLTAGGEITNGTAKYTFIADAAANVKVECLTKETDIVADANSYHEFKVTATDDVGNAAPGTKISFAATSDVSFSYLGVDGNEQSSALGDGISNVPTLADGTLTVRARSKKAWINFSTVVSYLNESSESAPCSGSPLTYSFVAGTLAEKNCSITATPTIQKAGENIELKIILQDENGNPCRDRTAIFKAAQTDKGATTSDITYNGSTNTELTQQTDSDGSFTILVSSKKVGKFKTDGSVILHSGSRPIKTVSYEFISSAPDASTSSVTLTKNNATSDGSDVNTIKVSIKDAYGNNVANASVKVAADADLDWGSGLGAEHTVTSDIKGEATLSAKSSTAKTYSSQVSLFVDGSYVAIASGSDNKANPVNHTFVASDPAADNCIIEVINSPAVADGIDAVTLQVTVKDESDNLVPNAKVYFYATEKVSIALGDKGTTSNSDPAGDWTVTADANGQASLYLTSTVANEPFSTLVALIKTDDTKMNIGEGAYTFKPGPVDASKSKVEMVKDGETVLGTNEVDVYLYDAYDNPIPSLTANVNVDFAATENIKFNNGTAGATYRHTLSAGGLGTFTVYLNTDVAGSYQTKVTIGGVELSGSPVPYHFKAAAPSPEHSTIEIIGNGTWSKGALIGGKFNGSGIVNSGEKVTIKITLRDEKGNPIPDVNMFVSNSNKGYLNFGDGTNEGGRKTTDADGQAIIYAVSSKIGRVDADVSYNLTGWDDGGFVNLTPTANPISFYFGDKYTTVDETQNMAVRAKWIILSQEEAPTQDQTTIIDKAGAQSWYLEGTHSAAEIAVSSLIDVNSAVVGPYELAFTATNPDDASNSLVRRGVVASVIDSKTAYNETLELAIYAEDYALTASEAKAHDAGKAKENTGLKAWSLSDWSKNDLAETTVPNNTQLTAIKNGVANVYDLTFAQGELGSQLDKAVKVTVLADDSWFITTWEVTAGEEIFIPVPDVSDNDAGYDFYISWGDGSEIERLTSFPYKHSYADAGTYMVKITGTFPAICFGAEDLEGSDLPLKIKTVEQWGTIEWKYMGYAFTGCENLTINKDAGKPDLSGVNNMAYMFGNALMMNSENLKAWDVSKVTNFQNMFEGAQTFNQDLSSWNVGAATNMEGMFFGAIKFNQNLSSWDVSKVINMSEMFKNAKAFDQSLASWQISVLTDADKMFEGAKLSVANYDATLISWNGQVEAGNAKQNVKFHGGLSEYCEAEGARKNLIDKGWGDGTAGGSYNNTDATGIIDGGTGRPVDYQFTETEVRISLGSMATITLDGSEQNVTYQLYNKATDEAVGGPVDGLASRGEISFTFTPTVAGTTEYYVNAEHTDFTCGAVMTDVIKLIVDPLTTGGVISVKDGANSVLCQDIGELVLQLSSYEGDIVRWESSVKGDFTDLKIIRHALPEYTVKNLQQNTTFRVVVQSGVSEAKYSSTIKVTVDPTTVGGITATNATAKICNNTTTSITLNDYVGNILRWEVSTDDGASWATAGPDGAGEDVYTTANLKNDSRKDAVYQFRALVQSGECNSAESTISAVTVLPKVVAVNYYATISDGKPITIPVLDSIKYSPVTLDRIGTPDQGGTAKLNADKTVSYSAKRGFVGEEKFKYYLTVDGLCQDSAYIVVTTNCLPHSMSDLTMEVCVDATHDINLVSYMPYAGLEEVSVWAEDGSQIDDATSYSSDNLKADNTTVFTYYYEKAGFCVGSESANIYINAVSNNNTANFGDKTISVCGVNLKEGGYKLNNLIPYASNAGAWDESLAEVVSGTSVSLDSYLNKDTEDGWVFDAQGFWSKVIEMNGGAVPDSVSVTIPYSVSDACVGVRTITLTIEITKD